MSKATPKGKMRAAGAADLAPPSFGAWLEAQGRSPHTRAAYLAGLAALAAWFEQSNGQAMTPRNLTPTDLSEYRAGLVRAGRPPATINARMAAARAYGAYIVATGQAQANPAQAARGIRQQPLQPRWLEKHEQGRLAREFERAIAAATTTAAMLEATRNLALFVLLIQTGLRVAECCALEVSDVEIKPRSGLVVVRQGKGDKARRVALNRPARVALAAWLELHPGALALFVGKGGLPLEPRAVQRILSKAGRRAGVVVTPHVLRHTLAHNLKRAGADLQTIAAILGHTTTRTTERYTLPGQAELAQALELAGG